MPAYDFRCPAGHVVEGVFDMANPPSQIPCSCGEQARRVYHAPAAIHFKAPGFYATDVAGKLHAEAVRAGALDLEGLAHEERQTAMERLTALAGVGRWTAEYVLLRGLGRIDTFPVDDVGARNKLARLLEVEHLDAAAAAEIVARWQPYAGMVYFHLLLDSLSRAAVLDPLPVR
jgi:predicted nucleic acid-binding Zn ribbon protein